MYISSLIWARPRLAIMGLLKPVLSPAQLRGIKDHKYSAQGVSIGDALLQTFWNWLVNLVPLWVAPNLITFTGLVVNIVTSVPIIVTDPNCMGKVRE